LEVAKRQLSDIDRHRRAAGPPTLTKMPPVSPANAVSPVILVVDDEPPIREIERRLLDKAGYRVVEASGAAEAFNAIEQHDRIDLVVADLDMPEVSGDEMVRRIRSLRPDLKVLYVTGHIDRLMDARPLWDGEAFLDKPFSMNGLVEAVSLLLYGRVSAKPQ
jgi:two-component system cell cycle sensor histidine kinase/response regulator CckA